ncbi:MAG: DUF4111 domain-containing protein [Actinobacteria bacterium]|nr:DUF4111 domain-containing protein [Actinomycetota bacterium]
MLPAPVADRVAAYLRGLDRVAPGWVEGAYVVGSTALGAWLPDRSDIDLFVLVDRAPTAIELAGLRRQHRRSYWPAALGALARGRYPLVCNVCVLRWSDLALAPADVVPIASHVSQRFRVGEGFDVNPVGYLVLATHGVAVRGPAVDRLTVHHDPVALHRWNLANLDRYWARWAHDVRHHPIHTIRARWAVQYGPPWGVLGAPRSHATCAAGEVLSKAEAGAYAREAFGPEWHPTIDAALAAWLGGGRSFRRFSAAEVARAAEFVDVVVASAHGLAEPQPS